MLSGVLCSARHKPWLLNPLSFSHGGAVAGRHRFGSPAVNVKLLSGDDLSSRLHSTACLHGGGGGVPAIWHAISYFHKPCFHHERKGEGSWNVSWDARPARWLHRPDSGWLLFGDCAAAAAAPIELIGELPVPAANVVEKIDEKEKEKEKALLEDRFIKNSANFRVKGVLADGRCLFRAIAHKACLRNGEEAPDEKLQTELADKLRAQVVNELLMRRKESEWFIEGDFDAYVERIRQPYVWGGEPELLMASHVLKTMISVYMLDRSSGSLINIANYGEEYQKNDESPIKVLFHGYGHYDILESVSEQSCEKAEA